MNHSSLKRKTLVAVSFMCIAVIAGVYFYSMNKLDSGFRKVEISEAIKNSNMVSDSLTHYAENIISKTSDWAQWDDAYSYVQNKNKKFEKSNLQSNITSLNFDILSFWSLDKKLVWGRNINLRAEEDSKKLLTLDLVQIKNIQYIDFIFRSKNYLDKKYSFAKLNDIPFLLVSVPITSTDGKSPIKGFLISGIKLDNNFFNTLGHQIHQTVQYADLNLNSLSNDSEKVKILDSDSLEIYGANTTIDSNSSLKYKIIIPRTIHELYKRTLNVFLIAMIFGGIAFVMVTLLLVNRLLTSRILTLLKLILKIKNTGDLTQRVPDLGDDEIGQLGHSFNEMFEEIEKLRASSFHNEKMASLGEMAGGIAHEINNPITIIGASTSIMKRMFEKGITDQAKYLKQLEDIDKTIIRISKIITGLKNVSRDTTHEDFSKTNLRDVLTDSLAICSEKFNNHGIAINVNLEDPIINSTINCLRVQLSQVFYNLFNNSFDAIEKLPNPWVKITASKLDNYLYIRCEDSGSGIPKEIQSKIFQPFYTTKEIGKGTGLGLSLCNSIIQRHGGEFYIDNELKNTCFVIKLPIDGANYEG